MESVERLSAIFQHISVDQTFDLVSSSPEGLQTTECSALERIMQLRDLLDGDQSDVRNRFRGLLQTDPILVEDYSLTYPDYREKVHEMFQRIVDERLVKLSDLEENPLKFFAWFEMLGYFDHSVGLKFAVQYNLWGGTVLLLGTQKHHEKYLDLIEQGRLLGCFGLTELGHGSNAQGLETLATYDATSDEFVIHSPTVTSQKYWPGHFAKLGRMATIFARLIIAGNDLGVHAFIVPLRNADGSAVHGVSFRDIGQKTCFNGIDNGAVSFTQVRIPRDNMLNRFSSVEKGGNYVSQLQNPRKHFAAMMGVFLGGRICIALLALGAMKVGVGIAVNYSFIRKQFGPAGKEEVPLIYHTTHQRRLMPCLAKIYALDFAMKRVNRMFALGSKKEVKMVHINCAGIKAIVTWEAINALQVARECCGGQGLRMVNRISQLRAECDMYSTGEGDNTVLLQQVARFLLAEYKSTLFKNIKVPIEQSDVKCHKWQHSALVARVELLVKELRVRLTASKDSGRNAFDAWNDNLAVACHAARAYVDALIHDSFVETCTNSKVSDECTKYLWKLCELDGLVRINDDLGWFCAHEVIVPKNAVTIDSTITALCSEVKEFSRELVKAFGVPRRLSPLSESIE